MILQKWKPELVLWTKVKDHSIIQKKIQLTIFVSGCIRGVRRIYKSECAIVKGFARSTLVVSAPVCCKVYPISLNLYSTPRETFFFVEVTAWGKSRVPHIILTSHGGVRKNEKNNNNIKKMWCTHCCRAPVSQFPLCPTIRKNILVLYDEMELQ